MRNIGSDFEADLRRFHESIAQLDRPGIVQRCRFGKRCSLLLQGQPYVCIDCDQSSLFTDTRQRRPDFIVATRTEREFVVLIVEMKSGKLELTDLRQQLQAGAEALSINSTALPNQIEVIPLILKRSSGFRSIDQRRREAATIHAFGSPRRIVVRPCGILLSRVLTEVLPN